MYVYRLAVQALTLKKDILLSITSAFYYKNTPYYRGAEKA